MDGWDVLCCRTSTSGSDGGVTSMKVAVTVRSDASSSSPPSFFVIVSQSVRSVQNAVSPDGGSSRSGRRSRRLVSMPKRFVCQWLPASVDCTCRDASAGKGESLCDSDHSASV